MENLLLQSYWFQHSDSTERDVRIMKKRSFILSDLLKGCLQRLDYNVLVPFLQVFFHKFNTYVCFLFQIRQSYEKERLIQKRVDKIFFAKNNSIYDSVNIDWVLQM